MRKPELRERIPSRPPLISPLHDETDQPVWSVMIAVDNTFTYLNTTLLSILELDQGIGVMQIMVVDDASDDGDVEQLVKDTGKGRIGYFRQPNKIGRLRNLETCIKLSRGKYVHILYGDNYVMPGFYDEILSLFNEFPRVGAAFTEFQYINERGNPIWKHQPLAKERGLLKNWVKAVALRQNTEPSAMVIKRTTYEKLGSFFGAEHGEFWEMTVRIAAHAELAYVPKVLANFRIHGKALHSEALKTGRNIDDITKIIGIIRAYLPLDVRDEVNAMSKKYFSQHFAQLSHKVYHELDDTEAALKQAWGALVLDINWISLKYSLLLFFKYLIGYKVIRKWVEKIS
ncbi:glycosyltransferase [Sediminibacterium sp. C3]|uniref:glycosyltransferase n=1 Tax=Sediminibacterium sp. C3 TaxID=1267211 RepID=UPI000565113B|nr:glycosyltransferase [Sediminibacterium sp. C3]